MKRRTIIALSFSWAVLGLVAHPSWAQIDTGNFTVSGEAEGIGLPASKTGKDAKFEEYRDIPESVIVPQLEFLIGSKKEDFYLEFDSSKVGLDDQNYRLRFGRYGLLDMEFEWDQIPHFFSQNTARTPYARDGGGGTYTLSSKPASPAGGDVRDWVNADANPLDLKLLQGIGKLEVRYTPTPGWTFEGSYRSQNTSGKRAFGAYFGPNPGNYNITELAEPIDYQTHNIEVGGEYSGKGWSLGLRYNGSLFHNNTSTLVWDNPLNPGIGSACTDEATYSSAGGTGPCRGRMDLYPSNQAHTVALSGAAGLPWKTRFMGALSYGWRLQDDSFLPFTINSAITQPALARSNLNGDVRPFMVNATLVNHFLDRLGLKAFYRYYDLDNRSKKISFPEGMVRNDQAPAGCPPSCAGEGDRSFPYSYSKQNVGLDASYKLSRWVMARLGYVWENVHRERREVLDSNEHIFGPTLDLTPSSWLLVRMSYKRQLRDASDYDIGRKVVIETEETPDDIREEHLEALRKFEMAARNRDTYSLFAQVTALQNLTAYAGFDFINDRFPRTVIGLKNNVNYVPSIGLTYAPTDWLTFFTDYNWDRYDWKMKAMERTSTAQSPETDPDRIWTSRGRDRVNTFGIGSDMELLKDLLKLRIQYTFSDADSKIRASGNSAGTEATDFPKVTTSWHEVLARFEYRAHKNVSLLFGYYFNQFSSDDFGLDIMKPWMGGVDASGNVQRSIFLGDNIKKSYTAHVGLLGMRFTF